MKSIGLRMNQAPQSRVVEHVRISGGARKIVKTKRSLSLLTYGLYRVDSIDKSMHGWEVTILRKNKLHRKFFADARCGGRKTAMNMAVRWRDKILQSAPAFSRMDYANIQKKSNKSGVPGVCRTSTVSQSGCDLAYWIAFWPTTVGKSRRAKFSVLKYGDDLAFEMAKSRREKEVARLSGELRIVSNMHREWLDTAPGL